MAEQASLSLASLPAHFYCAPFLGSQLNTGKGIWTLSMCPDPQAQSTRGRERGKEGEGLL